MSDLNVALMQQLGLTAPTTAASSGTTASLGSGQLSQSDFLQLMTAQLSNQDPTQPMDSGQFMAQIAQFSMVSGVQDMQSSIQQLVASISANQAMQAAALVGHQVVTAGSSAELGVNGTLGGAVNVSQAASDVGVGIYDGSGQLVKTLDLGAQGAGLAPFSWNGVTDSGATAPSGVYTIQAQANVNGETQAMTTYVAATVDSVSIDNSSQQVLLNTSNGQSVTMSDVQQIM